MGSYAEALAKQRGQAYKPSLPRNPLYGVGLWGSPDTDRELFYGINDRGYFLCARRMANGSIMGEVASIRLGVVPLSMMPVEKPANDA